MVTKTKYFTLSINETHYCISDKMSINWKEIALFPIPFFAFLFVFGGPIVASVVTIFVTILYTLFRFSAWFYFTELIIDKESSETTLVKKLFDTVNKSETLSEKFDFDKIEFKKTKSGGKIKYVLNYKTHKENILFILRNINEKRKIEEFLKNIKTGYNNGS